MVDIGYRGLLFMEATKLFYVILERGAVSVQVLHGLDPLNNDTCLRPPSDSLVPRFMTVCF